MEKEEEHILKEADIPEEEQKYFHGVEKSLSFSFPEVGEENNVIGDYGGTLYFYKISDEPKRYRKRIFIKI